MNSNKQKRNWFIYLLLAYSTVGFPKVYQKPNKIFKNDIHAIIWARYIQRENPKESFRMLSKLSKRTKYSYKWLIDLLHKIGQYPIIRKILPIVKKSYPEILKKDPDTGFQAAYALSKAHIVIKQPIAHVIYNPEAMDILVPLNNKFPSNYKIAALTSTQYSLNKEFENALTVSTRYLNTSPNRSYNFLEHFKNASRYLAIGNRSKAIESIQKSVELQPTFINGWLLAASLKEQDNKIDEAIKYCTIALKIIAEQKTPGENKKVEQYLIRLFFKQKKLQHKTETFVMKKRCFEQAMQLFDEKKYKKALEYLDKCLTDKIDTEQYNKNDLFTVKIVSYSNEQQDKRFNNWILNAKKQKSVA